MKHIKLFENKTVDGSTNETSHVKLFDKFVNENIHFEDGDEEDIEDVDTVYFYIKDGDKEAIVRLDKSNGGKWREYLERGDEPYGFGGKNYQSYLKPDDLLGWLKRDYDHAEIIDDDADFDEFISSEE